MYRTLRGFYMWPNMRKTIKAFTDRCKVCMEFQLAKERVKPLGLAVSLADVNPMDWVVADVFSIKGAHFV